MQKVVWRDSDVVKPESLQHFRERPPEKGRLVGRVPSQSLDPRDVLLNEDVRVEHVWLRKGDSTSGSQYPVDFVECYVGVEVMKYRASHDGIKGLIRKIERFCIPDLERYILWQLLGPCLGQKIGGEIEGHDSRACFGQELRQASRATSQLQDLFPRLNVGVADQEGCSSLQPSGSSGKVPPPNLIRTVCDGFAVPNLSRVPGRPSRA